MPQPATTKSLWYSDDRSAFRCIPMVLSRRETIPARATRSITYYGPRLPGTDANATPVSELDERYLLSQMLACSGYTLLTEHIAATAGETVGHVFTRWWHAIELDRAIHAPRLSAIGPTRPGDLDLVMGPCIGGRPSFDWLVGVEMKRMKFNFHGTRRMRLTKIDEAVEQARGYWELGVDQVLFAPLIVIDPEPWSWEPNGRGLRDEVHDRAVAKLLQEIEDRVPPGMGVIGLLYDAPPFTDPGENSEVSLYKFRRPGVNPKLQQVEHTSRRRVLVEGLQRFLSVAQGNRDHDVVRACMHKQCRRPVRVRAYEATGCPACGRSWLSRRGTSAGRAMPQ